MVAMATTSTAFEPSEYLTSIGGHYGPVEQRGAAVMRSLEFGTNRRKYGPFGWEEGTPFCFDFHSGLDFGGFHGRSTGSHLRPRHLRQKHQPEAPFQA
ncbi:Jacalin [Musa troglodytarum]|uniref:Jacalin n=1 Tax=Musa troglodytarum TaxID=320322 RepID=A0A9E7GPG9_9LILI|nr:Jacalin [Musa troglodytarum]